MFLLEIDLHQVLSRFEELLWENCVKTAVFDCNFGGEVYGNLFSFELIGLEVKKRVAELLLLNEKGESNSFKARNTCKERLLVV